MKILKIKLFTFLVIMALAMFAKDVSALTVSTSFTSAVAGAALSVRANDSYTFSVSGTFVGTVLLEKSQDGGQSWKIVKTATAAVSSTTFTADLENSGMAQYRFRCSAYTSGTIVTSLANAAKVYFAKYDDNGKLLFQIDDNGVTAVAATNSGLGAGVLHSDSSGVQTSSAVVNADVSASAAIDFSKLATLASGNFLVGNTIGVATSVALSGDVTMTNAGVSTVSNASVIGKVLTGYVSGAGTVASTDTVLQAFQKLNGNTVAAASGVAGTVSAGTQTFTGAKTFETQLIGKGTATNDLGAAGYIGEYLESKTGSAQSAGTSTQYFDMGSLALTVGDWDVDGFVLYRQNSATFTSTALEIALGTATGNSSTGVTTLNDAQMVAVLPNTFSKASLVMPRTRVSISSPTTYYLKGNVSVYTSGTPQYEAIFRARRVR